MAVQYRGGLWLYREEPRIASERTAACRCHYFEHRNGVGKEGQPNALPASRWQPNAYEENVRQQILDGLIADKGGDEQISTATRILAEVIASDASLLMAFNGAIDRVIQNNQKVRQNPRGLHQLTRCSARFSPTRFIPPSFFLRSIQGLIASRL